MFLYLHCNTNQSALKVKTFKLEYKYSGLFFKNKIQTKIFIPE